MKIINLKQVGLILIILFIGAGHAHAYLDGGAGSLLLQYLIGALAGLAIFFKVIVRGLQALWAKFTKKNSD